MKIWEIVKEDFENNKPNLDEGWKEKMMTGALAASMALGGKAMDKSMKPEPKKIEYTTSFDQMKPDTINKIKQDYALFIKNNTPSFGDFRNYSQIIDYINNLDIITVGDKVSVVDEFNNRTPINLSIQTQEEFGTEIKKIFGKYITSFLIRLKERGVAKEFRSYVDDQIAKAFRELTDRN